MSYYCGSADLEHSLDHHFHQVFGLTQNYQSSDHLLEHPMLCWACHGVVPAGTHKAGDPNPKGWQLQGNYFCLGHSHLMICCDSAGKWSSWGSGQRAKALLFFFFFLFEFQKEKIQLFLYKPSNTVSREHSSLPPKQR